MSYKNKTNNTEENLSTMNPQINNRFAVRVISEGVDVIPSFLINSINRPTFNRDTGKWNNVVFTLYNTLGDNDPCDFIVNYMEGNNVNLKIRIEHQTPTGRIGSYYEIATSSNINVRYKELNFNSNEIDVIEISAECIGVRYYKNET